jgi:hypothetical protein
VGGTVTSCQVEQPITNAGLTANAWSSLIETVGASLARAADNLSVPLSGGAQSMTGYLRYFDQGVNVSGNTFDPFTIGGSTAPFINVSKTGTGWTATYNNGSVAKSASVTVSSVRGDLLEFRVPIAPNGLVSLGVTINHGTEVVAAAPSAAPLPANWNQQKVWVNSNNTFGTGQGGYTNLFIYPGVLTLPAIRTLAGQT